jgi:uncharacterized protein (TIGR02678 family)
LTRRLLDDPVVYYSELAPDELAYLHRQRGQIVSRITEATGLVAEARAEGIAMVDPDDQLTDVRMPAQGMQSHLTLLLAEFIATHRGGVRLTALHQHTKALAQRFKSVWRKDATDAGAEHGLVLQAVEALRALRLVAVETGDDPLVTPRAAISRYALAEPSGRKSTVELL